MLPLLIGYCSLCIVYYVLCFMYVCVMYTRKTSHVQQISVLLQVKGRPVLGSLEMGEGPALSGLISGQPR